MLLTVLFPNVFLPPFQHLNMPSWYSEGKLMNACLLAVSVFFVEPAMCEGGRQG